MNSAESFDTTEGGVPMTGFADDVRLTREEVFEALEACAVAESALLATARRTEAALVSAFFELLEHRLTRCSSTA